VQQDADLPGTSNGNFSSPMLAPLPDSQMIWSRLRSPTPFNNSRHPEAAAKQEFGTAAATAHAIHQAWLVSTFAHGP